MQTLGQFLGVLQGKKSSTESVKKEAYHLFQKEALFDGLQKTYSPKDEDGERLPSETKLVQQKASTLVRQVQKSLAEMLNISAAVDKGNTVAKGDIIVDDKVLAKDVPTYTLIFLQKQLDDVKTFVSAIPVLSPGCQWTKDDNSNLYLSTEQESARTVKITEPFVVQPPTKEHPAIVKDISKDIIAGYWKKKDLSGRLSQSEKDSLLEKVMKLREGVVKARELANTTKVESSNLGDVVTSFLFD